jgi:hypothetical protein
MRRKEIEKKKKGIDGLVLKKECFEVQRKKFIMKNL